ncbi:DUF2158 domain-containing protein [Sphingomonas sp.]|uniref:DUF2158 domain-containing protein n=1 Tax=Sphingomonas sp. TaxID=28214 RepID=UPI002FC70CF5
MAKFNIGDLVKSKAGGPKMVVDQVFEWPGDETRYHCIWWVGNKRHREQFAHGGLETWKDDAG